MIRFALLVAYMACAYRYRGGWRLGLGYDSPRWLELLAVSWPAAVVAWLAIAASPALTLFVARSPLLISLFPGVIVGTFVFWLALPAALGVLAATMGAHSLGHGTAMNLGRRPYTGTERAEVWDVIVGPPISGTVRAQRWRRDAYALLLSGITVVFPVALALGFAGRPGSADIWLAVGAGKLAAYEIGWRLHRDGSHWRQGTEIGEALFGAMLGAAAAVTL